MSTLQRQIHLLLQEASDPQRAQKYAHFFKTQKGQYAEGDIFLGVTVPTLRKLASQYITLPLTEVKALLTSKIHENRTLALLILIKQYPSKKISHAEKIPHFYLQHLSHVNHWDLVDLSAPHILGPHLYEKDPALLHQLATSSNLWERRISIITTLYFVRRKSFATALTLAEKLLTDKEPLIHKATGWVLREVGKKDRALLCTFLDQHHHHMPRTMLRYAIEHFSEDQRKYYLSTQSIRFAPKN